jgi:hypothetical protein
VGGRHCVGVVPTPCLPTFAPNISGRVVDRRYDKPIGSFVVHLPNVVLPVDPGYKEMITLFLIFFSNVLM